MKTQKCKQCAAHKREIEKLKGSIRALQTRADYFEEKADRVAVLDKAICKIMAAVLEVPPPFSKKGPPQNDKGEPSRIPDDEPGA